MKISRKTSPILVAMLLALSAAGTSVAAAATYDFNPDPGSLPPGALPGFVASGGSPVYITNTTVVEAGASASVDSLRVGQRAGLNIGFDADRAASGAVGLEVANNMIVEGQVRVGTEGARASWLPGGRTGQIAALSVDGVLSVEKGGSVVVEGGVENGTDIRHSGVFANRIDVNGGVIQINPSGGDSSGELHVTAGMAIRNGGRVVVNGRMPPRDTANEMTDVAGAPWELKGLGLGGGGLDVGQAGVLASGEEGAVVEGAGAATDIRVQRGGYLDAADSDMLLRSVGDTVIDGTYRSGAGSQLTSEGGRIVLGDQAKAVLSTDLYRSVNASASGIGGAPGAASGRGEVIARASEISLAPGAAAIRSGMGFYTLGVTPFDDTSLRNGELLRIAQASRAVLGNGAAGDRAQFHSNIETIWGTPVEASQATAMYDLLAARYPTVAASGEAGEFNKAALEALMNGPGVGIPARGVADRGVAELYSGGAQWGVNNVAFSTAELFMAGLDRRVHRLGAELDRLGHEEIVSFGAASDSANASLLAGALAGLIPEGSGDGRVWGGALYARDEVDTDGGVSGYTYRPRGLMLGYDKTLGSWSLGGAAAFARGNYEDKAATAGASGDSSGNSEIDSYSAGLFAAYHGGDGFNASAFGTFSALDNDLSDLRGGMRREADFTSTAWSLGARVGYDMALTDRMLVQPSIGVTHVRADSNSHDEFLDSVDVMRVGDVTRSGTLVPLDLTVGYDLLRGFDSLFRLNAGLGYAYDFGADAPEGVLAYSGLSGAPDIAVSRREPGRHRFNLGLGLIYTRERFDWTARYDYVRRAGQDAHQAQTGVGVKF